ncbi:oligopeptide transport system substrate-binding protein [Aliiroseovarius crassostreae]|uniref:Peptide ABC transporter substrate-binding protein n=1 Tax=Aliiroseovarius crassostreae TaxID=154981 RepID=A0A0P7KPC6_9RHOB|nr:peptide ABC transporter substrate-binding protein [Aliiroseovarius crassostreae]KPN64191.1 peptide ABC transporter substrate-binding protein [Aliiroseovarius crassostreae]SFU29654.1 oligopeptide transport system substrate-binding protein [Aliiroseovarius crassostreae]
MTFTIKAALLGSAFALASPALAAGTHPVTGEKLADDQTFTYRVLDEHTSVDPQIVEDVTGSEIVRDLFEGLYNQDKDGNLVPGVATGFTTNEDKTVYTFTLRDNAKWSDGTPVTAGDFVYAWRRLADPATASEYQWYVEVMNLKNAGPVMAGEAPLEDLGVKAIDDHTLEVTLESSLPYFALTTTHTSTFPAPKWAIEKHGADWIKPENIVVNGAYKLTEHVANERSVRERNEMYWDNENTIIDKTVALVINDENVALTRYMAGELDRTEIPAGQYPALSQSHPKEAVVFPRLCSYYYTINVSENAPEFLKDVRVRQALSYAINRDIIVDKVLQAGQTPAYTFTPGTTAGFEVPTVEYATWTQAERNAKAAELMAEAGYGKDNPLSLTLIYNTDEAHKKTAIAVSQMWKQALGVNVSLENQEWKTFLNTRGEQNYEIARAGWCGDYNEASTFLDLVQSGSGYNDAKYSNAEVDALLKGAKTMDNPQPNYTKVEEIIAADMPLIPIYHYTEDYMLKSSIAGSWPVKNVEQNWYSKDLYKVAE